MDKKDTIIKELEQAVEYYKDIAEKNGRRRIQEVEQLNRLIAKTIESEKALMENEERFRLIAQSTSDIFYEWNCITSELEWFGDIDGVLGYEPGEIRHAVQDWLNIIHPQDRSLLEDAVLFHKKSAKLIEYTYRVICKDGSIRYWKETGSPVLDQEGRPLKWVGGISDITEQKKAEETLIMAQRLSAIGELASGVAHDFNNSLQGIFGNTELALLEDISPEVRNYLNTIKKSATDAATRIQHLLRFSGKGKGRKDYEILNLNTIVADVITQTRPLWKDESEKNGLVITIKTAYSGEKLVIKANAGELRSVLYNIIKNSVHAMPDGGALSFITGKNKQGVYVTVTDTGTGMNEETKTRIFQPFFTTKGFGQGMGLGMSTTYTIVKEHGGEIYVKKTEPGKGTSIEITLPFAKKEEIKSKNGTYNYGYPARILWVDDEEMVRNVGKRQLEKLKHYADTAASGLEALNMLKTSQYDLMITDIGMPNMSGWQLTEKIKGNFPGMKVVVVTGWDTDISNEDKEKYGIGYVLGKPIDLEQLQNLIAEVMQLKQK